MKTKNYNSLPLLWASLCWLFAFGNVFSQNTLLNNGGAKIVVDNGANLKTDALQNNGTGSQIINNGNLYLKGNFSQTNGATYTGGSGSWLWFDGTTTQTISSDASPLAIPRLKIDNAGSVQISQNLSISNSLDVVNGDLDMNGKNIDLGSTGILNENRTNNHIVTDNTALSDYAQGGSISFTSTVTNASTEIRGTGLTLTHTGASPANDYTVNVMRKHYRGAVESRGGHGIERIYQISSSPATITSTNMRIDYATDEAVGAGSPSDFVLYRWSAATGWQKGGDGGANFVHGTNNVASQYTTATGITSFSHWTVGSSLTPLPITLLDFNGERVEKAGELSEDVKLTWQTASETNNKGFEIEVSENGLTYQKIAFVEGKGNSTTQNSYQLAVNNPSDSYYRLRQVDFDGKFSYSPIVFIEGLVGKVLVYPNPNNGNFTIQYPASVQGKVTLRLLNTQGIEIWKNAELNPKGGKIDFSPLGAGISTANYEGLPSGMYYLHIASAGKAKVVKIIVQK